MLEGPSELPRTGSSLGCAPGCYAGGREFFKITEEKVLPLKFHLQMVRLSSLLG